MVGDIKRRGISPYGLWSHRTGIEFLLNLLWRSLFYYDILARWTGSINGRGGAQDIEGNPIVFCKDGNTQRTDFIGNVSISSDTVTAHKTEHRKTGTLF